MATPEIIDLVDSGDDIPMSLALNQNTGYRSRENSNDDNHNKDDEVKYVGSTAPAPKNSAKRRKVLISTTERMDIDDKDEEEVDEDDDDDDDRKPATIVKSGPALANTKNHGIPPDDEDADIQVVETPLMVPEDVPSLNVPPYASMPANKSLQNTNPDAITMKVINDENEEVAIVGTRYRIRLPHMRPHCTEHVFATAHGEIRPQFVTRLQQNMTHCDLCYCYICDVPVHQCTKEWSVHCYATDSGPEAPYYQQLRQEKRIEKAQQQQQEQQHQQQQQQQQQQVARLPEEKMTTKTKILSEIVTMMTRKIMIAA